MAWQGPHATLGPGQSVRWSYSWGAFNGIQVTRARPANLSQEPVVVSEEGVYQEERAYGTPWGLWAYVYTVTLTNTSQLVVSLYDLVGGQVG